jgi:hypothetical protein
MPSFYYLNIQSWDREWYNTNAKNILDLILSEVSSRFDTEIKVVDIEQGIRAASEAPEAYTLTYYLMSKKHLSGENIKRIALKYEKGRLEGKRVCDIDVAEYDEREIRIEDLPEFKNRFMEIKEDLEKQVIQDVKNKYV